MVDGPAQEIHAAARHVELADGVDVRLGGPITLPRLSALDAGRYRAVETLTHMANAARARRARGGGHATFADGLHQVLQTAGPWDAVSNDALALQDLLRDHGYTSEVFAEHVHPSLAGRVHLVDQVDGVDSATLVYHVSTSAPRIVRTLARRRGAVLLRYHNITPASWFDGVSVGHRSAGSKARAELAQLVSIGTAAVADSAFNAEEIRALGMTDVTEIPILLAPAEHPRAWVGGGRNAISVGRIAPNKRIDFLLRTIAAYQRTHDPDFGLVLVGSDRGLERYSTACRELERELGVRNVHWVGSVDEAEKLRLMAEADAYLCASDHEGFCVPIVESFRLGLPVVARATTAVTGTCGDALAVDTADPAYLANVLRVVATRPDLRDALIDVQHQEAKRFDPDGVGGQLLAWVRAHVGAPS